MITTQETTTAQTARHTPWARRLVMAILVLAAAGSLGFGIRGGIEQRVAAGKELAQATDEARGAEQDDIELAVGAHTAILRPVQCQHPRERCLFHPLHLACVLSARIDDYFEETPCLGRCCSATTGRRGRRRR